MILRESQCLHFCFVTALIDWHQSILPDDALLCYMTRYALQGIPLGLAFGSLPFVLSEKLSYADQADFSISAYPYSLKLLWSPVRLH